MKTLFFVMSLTLIPLGATADGSLVRFDGGIGVDPVAGIVSNTPSPNVVRGIPPGGFPWVIKQLRADVTVDGRVHVDVRGLILAGGNVIGTNGGQRVVAMLFCGAPGPGGSVGTATAHSSDPAGVPLDPNGNVEIDDVLTPAPPSPCDNAALLIVTPGTHHWFAAGIPKVEETEKP